MALNRKKFADPVVGSSASQANKLDEMTVTRKVGRVGKAVVKGRETGHTLTSDI